MARAWYSVLLPGLTPLLDTRSSLPCGVAETLQCIELFVEAFWQALPIRMLKYGPDFQLKQLTAVQDVVDIDAYAVFATEVGQAELDGMDELGLQVPYLPDRADKQAASKCLAEGWASVAEPATKRQRVELRKETAEPGSALAAKRKEYAALMESLECARLDMVMAQERARLARTQPEAEAAIAAGNRAVQPTQTATATTDIPCMLNLQSICITKLTFR